jgi:hypothetical protein
MKKRRKTPYIFIALLIAIIIFIVGTRYGQKVEKTNKTINYLLSITPTKIITPSAAPTISYNLYTHEGCNISFLKPSYLAIKKETSTSAFLISDKKEKIEFNCSIDKKDLLKVDQKIATNSVDLNNKKYAGVKTSQEKNTITNIVILSPDKKETVNVSSNNNLFSIIEQTFNFLP